LLKFRCFGPEPPGARVRWQLYLTPTRYYFIDLKTLDFLLDKPKLYPDFYCIEFEGKSAGISDDLDRSGTADAKCLGLKAFSRVRLG
jgi:hypothetical protein